MGERCLAPTEIQEGDLLAYVEGEASPAVARHIARCPVCAAEVAGLREMESLFSQALSSLPTDQAAREKLSGRTLAGLPSTAARQGRGEALKFGLGRQMGWQPLLALSLLFMLIGGFTVAHLFYKIPSSEPSVPLVAAKKTLEAAIVLEETASPDANGLRLAKQAAYEFPFIANIEASAGPPTGNSAQHPVIQHKIIDVAIADRIIVEENFEIAPPLQLRRDSARTPSAGSASFPVHSITANFRSRSVIADHIGNRYVVEVDNDHGSATLHFTSSIDRGQTWRPATRIYSGVGRLFNPHLTIDDDQNLYVVWQNWRNIDRYTFYFARSTDGGRSWSEAVRIDDTTKRTVNPKLTIASDGVLFVTWQKRRSLNTGLYATRSTDGGQTWSDGVRLLNIGS